jgi:ABC-type branched-subunit amino acid transport system substrate-binding protein
MLARRSNAQAITAVLAVTGVVFAGGCGSSSSKATAPSSTAVAPSSTAIAPSPKATAPGVSSNTITLGLLESVTGTAAGGFLGTTAGAMARIDAQNAVGGVDGRHLNLVVGDDASSPAQNLTVAQSLVETKHVFGVISDSAFTLSSARFLQQNGIPVVGEGYDGPEWGEQPYTNMFSVLGGDTDPDLPQYTQPALFMKQLASIIRL